MTDIPPRDPGSLSFMERLAADPDRAEFLNSLTRRQRRRMLYDWRLWRRPSQTAPSGRWKIWVYRGGRGTGKTRTGTEWVKERVATGVARRITLIAQTPADARDVMIEGESGIMNAYPPDQQPDYEPSKLRITWPNGAIATIRSAATLQTVNRLRGPQHDTFWFDEPAAARFGQAALDQALLGLRMGSNPQGLLTTTPKPLMWLRDLEKADGTVTTVGTTYENLANLAPSFIDDVFGRYGGTRLGRQEIDAEYLGDIEGALWHEHTIERGRWPAPPSDLSGWRCVVGVDPPGETAECGIIVAAIPRGRVTVTTPVIILADRSLAGRPEVWGAEVVQAWRDWDAEAIIVEANQGGDMVRAVVHNVDQAAPVEKAWARRSKKARAEPVATLYERGRVHHVGYFPMLESLMVTWVPGEGKSPDRLDAMVWAVAYLLPEYATARGSLISVTGQLPLP